jgi:hypothetical protein
VVVETMRLDGVEVPITDAQRWRDFAIDTRPTRLVARGGPARGISSSSTGTTPPARRR